MPLIKQFFKFSALIVISSFFTGCASTSNITMDKNYSQKTNKTITIAITKPPKPTLNTNGSGLVGSIINEGMMSNLKIASGNSGDTTYKKLTQQIAFNLSARHIQAIIYPDFYTDGDLNSLTKKSNLTNEAILVIKVNAIGISRHYSEFIPNGPPNAYISLTGELVNCSTKTILWRYNVSVAQPIKGDWDQPPYYPNFQDAFNKALTLAGSELINNFFLANE